jgi:hypothetical protein
MKFALLRFSLGLAMLAACRSSARVDSPAENELSWFTAFVSGADSMYARVISLPSPIMVDSVAINRVGVKVGLGQFTLEELEVTLGRKVFQRTKDQAITCSDGTRDCRLVPRGLLIKLDSANMLEPESVQLWGEYGATRTRGKGAPSAVCSVPVTVTMAKQGDSWQVTDVDPKIRCD